MFKLIFTLFLFFTTSFASQVETDKIAQLIALPLYNLDKSTLKSNIEVYVKNRPDIVALSITEELGQEVYLTLYKENDKLIFDTNLSKKVQNFNKFQSDSRFSNEKVGEVTAYYDLHALYGASYKFTQSTKNLTALINFVSFMSKTVHVLQEERGVATGFVSSNGTKFKSKLDTIKIKSDAAKQELLVSLNLNYEQLKKYFNSDDRDSLNLLFNEVFTLREDVQNLKIDFAKTYSKYTHIITYLLLNISDISDKVENKELMDAMYSYSILLMHKESIGQKRAALSGLFSQEEFSREIYEYFLTSDTQEKIYLKSFLRSVDEKTKRLYIKTLDTLVTKKVKKYEKLALKKLQGGSINVNPEEWFETITQKINLVKKIEQIVFDDILSLVKEIDNYFFNSLSQEEKSWLSSHNVINVANETDYAPWDFTIDSKPVGYSIDYIKLLAKKTGLKLNFITDSWKNLIDKTKAGEIDLIHTMYKNNVYSNLIFVAPYKKVVIGIYVNEKTTDIHTLHDLSAKNVSIPKGDSTFKVINKVVKDINFHLTDGYVQTLKEVAFSKADATVIDMAVANHLIKENTIPNLKIVAEAKIDNNLMENQYYLAVNEKLPILASILKKAMDLVTNEEKKQITKKWFSDLEAKTNNSKNLNIAFNFDRPPFMFGETSSKGIESDLVKEILESRGYEVEISQMSKEYLENILHVENNVDGVSAVTAQDDDLFYSDDFVSFINYAITHKEDNIKINSIDDLAKIKFVSWKGAYNDLGEEFYNLFNPTNGTEKNSYSDSASQADDIRKFFEKKTDAIVIDKTIFQWYKLKYKDSDKYEFHKIFPKTTSFPAVFKSKKVRDDFNIGLKELKKSGRYNEIIEFYIEQDIQPLLEYANLIANISGKFMFSAKEQELEAILKEFFQHPDIVHIDIFNNATNQNFLSLYKEDGLIVKGGDTDSFHHLPSIKKDIYFSNKGTPLLLGKVNIFYKKSFTNDKAELIPSLSYFIGLERKDKEKIEKSYEKFGFNVKNIELTQNEKEWLRLHQVVKFTGDPDWLPFEAFNSQGEYIGIISEYLNALEKLIGIKFQRVATSSWSDSIKLSEDKVVDVLSETIESDRKNLIFTKPYITNEIIIVMDKEHKYVEGLETIKNDRIALVKDYGYTQQIREKYPNIDFAIVNTVSDGLTAVSTGKIDALVCTFALGSYTTTKLGISNIKIVGKTQFTTSLGLGVRDDYAPLVNILNKAIDAITQEEHNEIFNHWIKQDYVEKVDYSRAYQVSAAALILILLFVFWNRKMAQEITKRKEAQKEIKASRSRFSALFNTSPDAIMIIDKEGIFTDCNEATLKVFGVDSKKEFLGHGPEIYSPLKQENGELSSEESIRIFHDVFTKGIQKFDWIHIRSSTKELFPAEVILAPIKLNDEFYIYAITRDISERKILEKELEDERNFIGSIISSSQDALIVIDKTSKVTTWNNSATKIFGYIQDEMIGKPVDKIIPNKFRELHQAGVSRVTSNGEAKLLGKGAIEIEGMHKDGRIIPIDLALNSFLIKGEIFFSANIRDISERKELTDKIKDAKLNLETITETITDLIFYKDLDLKYTGANKAFYEFIGISKEELLGKTDFDIFPENIANEINAIDRSLLKTSKSLYFEEDVPNANGEVRNLATQKHVLKDINAKTYGMVGSVTDITERKQLEIQMKEAKEFTQTLLDSQEQIIITTDGKIITSVNKTFLNFYNVSSKEDFIKEYKSNCICETFNVNAPKGYLQIVMDDEEWIDYIISNSEKTHKAMISIAEINYIFSVTAAKLPGDKKLKSAVFTNITDMEIAKQKVETINKHTRESIEYASLIQGALIPNISIFNHYFSDYLEIWQPKDIVGGDIYLLEELRDRDECLLMVIDCTGHGVPGAFVTMLVKAIERQVVAKINSDGNIDVSPAWILSYFNKTMKKLLQQESKDSISNAGFDGGVIYYNKKDKIVKFSGAETPLFYIEDGELKTIKGDRHSIGYKKSDSSYEFTDHIIKVKEGMQFYCSTDGYIDQNGGEKGFPFGKIRFSNLIKEYYKETFSDQQEVLLEALSEYQANEDRNDDITMVGFKI